MLRIRKVEESISKNYYEWKMRCPVHLSIGQEAPAVGIIQNLSKKEKLYCTQIACSLSCKRW